MEFIRCIAPSRHLIMNEKGMNDHWLFLLISFIMI